MLFRSLLLGMGTGAFYWMLTAKKPLKQDLLEQYGDSEVCRNGFEVTSKFCSK